MLAGKYTLKSLYRIIFSTIILLACLLSLQVFLYAGKNININAVSKASSRRIGIGQRLTYTTTIFSDYDIEINVPEAQGFGAFEIRNSGILRDRHLNKYRIRLWYRLIAYETGSRTLPGLEIDYRIGQGEWKKVQSNDISIYVESVFERSKIEADIRSIEPPIGLRFPYRFHLLIGIPASIAAFYLLFLLARHRKHVLEERKKGPAKNLLAYKRLFESIDSVSRKRELNPDDFIKLSNIIRQYLGFNFNMDSGRLTTEEFLDSISQQENFYIKYGAELSFALRTCDMVKFANHVPGQPEHERVLVLAKAIKNDVPPNRIQE